jgi:hypothetical protein
MTDCNTQPLLFSKLKNKKIQADFAGGYPYKDIFVHVLARLKVLMPAVSSG